MKATADQEQPKAGLCAWQHCVVFLLACVVIISRRPDAVLNAQFWSEDGHVFFADAYNHGWWFPLFSTYQGYIHVFPRLAASLALLVPLRFAPLVLNLVAIGMQALPANLLLSSRSSGWGSLRFRAFMACMYLALPNCWEINANITNTQSLLALNAILLLVARRPHTAGEWSLDVCILLFCGLSGPFCILLLPIAVLVAWKQHDRWRWVEAGILAMTCIEQARSLLGGGYASRWHYALGASPEMFIRILAGQFYLGTILGGLGQPVHVSFSYVMTLIAIAVAGTVLVAICFFRAPVPMRFFLLFSFMLMAVSLISPALGPLKRVTVWEIVVQGGGARYWFIPTLAFGWVILCCFQSRTPALKTISALLLCIMCFPIGLRWRHPARQDLHFAEYAREFETAPTGTAVTIPQNPAGWNLTLVKHP